MIKRRAFELAEHMRILPRGPEDLEVAKMLEQMGVICDAARDVVLANTHEQSKAAYSELVTIFKGKRDD